MGLRRIEELQRRGKLDVSHWIQPFREQASGVEYPSAHGYISVSRSSQAGKGDSRSNTPITIVSPVQQAVEQAKAEIKREGVIKRKSSSPLPHLKKKQRKGKTSQSKAKPKKGKIKKKIPSLRDIFRK